MSIELMPMRQLAEVKDCVDDDWTGVSDLQERRKRQNKLSKRAQRRRLAAGKLQRVDANYSSIYSKSSCSDPTPGNVSSLSVIKSPTDVTAKDPSSTSDHFRIWFPLPSDHLLTLIQFNVYRATWINLALVTPAAVKSVDYLSGMNIFPQSLPLSMPSSLSPTILQRRIRHPAWIDAAPLATLRDNMIMANGTYDEDALCLDLLGGLFYSNHEVEHKGMMVWADPWNIAGWEMTEGFVRKWGFLLKGCAEIFNATNYWRRTRQEDPLSVDIITPDLP